MRRRRKKRRKDSKISIGIFKILIIIKKNARLKKLGSSILKILIHYLWFPKWDSSSGKLRA